MKGEVYYGKGIRELEEGNEDLYNLVTDMNNVVWNGKVLDYKTQKLIAIGMVGNEIADDLKLLRDNTPVTPFDEIREVIEGEIGQPLEEVYSEFNEEPLGSASIGQVYKATLKENGMDVACFGVFWFQFNNDVATFMIVNETEVVEGASFSGMLMDSYSYGVPNQTVTFHKPGYEMGTIVTATTDENGEFTIENAQYLPDAGEDNYYGDFTFAGNGNSNTQQ